MRHYFAIVEKDEESAFGVWFPDVVGCFSAADSPEDVLKNATEALSLHLGCAETIPEPRNENALKSDADVSDALKNGAYLLAVPF